MEDDEDGNIRHIAEHGLTITEVEEVIRAAPEGAFSRSSRRPLVSGFTLTGRYVVVIYEQVDEDTIYPVTAYEPEEK